MKECSVAQTVVLRRGIVGAAQSGTIYQFKVALIGINPPIWRRVQVAGDYTWLNSIGFCKWSWAGRTTISICFELAGRSTGHPIPTGLMSWDWSTQSGSALLRWRQA